MLVKPTTIVEDQSKYVGSIQAGRGLAALLVLFHHAAEKVAFTGGNHAFLFPAGAIGVDIFFMISGFIICHVTMNTRMSHRDYFMKRVIRVLPLYWALSFVALILYLLNPQLVNSHSAYSTSLVWSFLLIPTGHPFLVNNGWTLTYEFIFYIVWGALVIPKATRPAIWGCCLLLIGVSTLSVFDIVSYTIFNPSLLFEFAIGVCTALAYRKGLLKSNMFVAAAFIALGLMLSIALSDFIKSPLRGYIVGFPAGLLFFGIILIGRAWECVPLASTIGDSSYSLYLFHPFILALIPFAIRFLGIDNQSWLLLIAVLACIGALVASYAIYRYVELPVTSALRRLV